MTNITFSIDDDKKALLEKVAEESQVSVDILINKAIDHYLSKEQLKFQEAMDYVLLKNKELYKRLGKN